MSELKRMIIGFVLTSILGGFVGAWIQENARISSRKQEEAMNFYKEISSLMNRRLVVLHKFIEADSDKDDDDRDYVLKLATQSEQVRDEWLSNAERNLTLLRWYFGDGVVVTAYNKVNAAAENAETNQLSKTPKKAEVNRDIDAAWLNLRWFNEAAIKRLGDYKAANILNK